MEHFNSEMMMPGWSVQQMEHDKCLYRFDGPLKDEKRSITFAYMNIDDVESVTTELDDGFEIMRQFNLQYIVRMCVPQLLQLRRKCGFKTVKMRKSDLMESMILQLYDQFPSQASAPNHWKAKGLNYAQMDSMAGI
jgi:hypothetical protein